MTAVTIRTSRRRRAGDRPAEATRFAGRRHEVAGAGLRFAVPCASSSWVVDRSRLPSSGIRGRAALAAGGAGADRLELAPVLARRTAAAGGRAGARRRARGPAGRRPGENVRTGERPPSRPRPLTDDREGGRLRARTAARLRRAGRGMRPATGLLRRPAGPGSGGAVRAGAGAVVPEPAGRANEPARRPDLLTANGARPRGRPEPGHGSTVSPGHQLLPGRSPGPSHPS